MQKSESVQENEAHKILWDFEIQMDHPISARRPDQALINKKKKKKNLSTGGFCCSSRPQNKTERKRNDRKILGFC